MVAPFLSLLGDHLCWMVISAIVVEQFGMTPYWLSSRTLVHDHGFHETICDNLRHFRNTGHQGYYWSQFLFDVDHWFVFGQGGNVSHFPDGRRMLFGERGVQDFRDDIGHQITVFFQQPARYSVRFHGLRTSSAFCTRCFVALKISGDSHSRGT